MHEPVAWISEAALQDWLIAQLEHQGVACQKEVVTHIQRTRSDIVTSDTVIECKKYLTREKIQQAASQVRMYATHLGKQYQVIIGMPPRLSERQAAISVARNLQTVEPNLSIYWLTPTQLIPIGIHRPSVLDRIVLRPGSYRPVVSVRQPIRSTVQPIVPPTQQPTCLVPRWSQLPVSRPQPPVDWAGWKAGGGIVVCCIAIGFFMSGAIGGLVGIMVGALLASIVVG